MGVKALVAASTDSCPRVKGVRQFSVSELAMSQY